MDEDERLLTGLGLDVGEDLLARVVEDIALDGLRDVDGLGGHAVCLLGRVGVLTRRVGAVPYPCHAGQTAGPFAWAGVCQVC